MKILLDQGNIRRANKRFPINNETREHFRSFSGFRKIFFGRRNICRSAKNVFLLKDKTIRFIFFDNRSSYKTHFIYSSQRAHYDFKI